MPDSGCADGQALERLSRLVSIESPTGHAPGLQACYDLVADWSDGFLGTAHREVRDGVPHLYREERDRSSASGRPVLLLGHMDTVWPLGTLAAWPFAVDGERVTGPGVFDMKSGLVLALQALRAAGRTGHVRLLVTGDEEVGSTTSRALVEEAARDCAAVLVLEPGLDGALKTARKGGAMYRVEVTGRAAHAGLEPERGVNALLELAHQVLAITELGDDDRGTSVSPTVARAGSTRNTIPESAYIEVDVRAWDRDELERVEKDLRSLRPRTPGAGVELTGGVNRLPLERRMSAGLLDTARRVARAEGLPPVREARVGGASDGNFTAALGVPTLDGLGPTGGGAHARDEWVDAASLEGRTALIAALVRALAPPES
ncbi:M20 family peptidase [Streptomyces armeniacus]|uniref:M20 family peptidase n=1 Tax=Streptomyces armeniacus TaxID=83291 RepID=A0A345XJ55_9ACTN|nr:M20 family metallopeptidase [Streptomyces armeniacus]AXK31671.1 M20 family peptidase [Streptomyces armeniacus]